MSAKNENEMVGQGEIPQWWDFALLGEEIREKIWLSSGFGAGPPAHLHKWRRSGRRCGPLGGHPDTRAGQRRWSVCS